MEKKEHQDFFQRALKCIEKDRGTIYPKLDQTKKNQHYDIYVHIYDTYMELNQKCLPVVPLWADADVFFLCRECTNKRKRIDMAWHEKKRKRSVGKTSQRHVFSSDMKNKQRRILRNPTKKKEKKTATPPPSVLAPAIALPKSTKRKGNHKKRIKEARRFKMKNQEKQKQWKKKKWKWKLGGSTNSNPKCKE